MISSLTFGAGLKEERVVREEGELPKSMFTYSDDKEIEVERGAEKLRGRLADPL